MSQLLPIFNKLKNSNEFIENAQILTVVLNAHLRGGKPTAKADLRAIDAFVFVEMRRLMNVIPQTEDYKKLDDISDYEDKLLGLVTLLINKKYYISEDKVLIMRTLMEIVQKTQALQIMTDETFKLDLIDEKKMIEVLSVFKEIESEYQKSKLYLALIEYRRQSKVKNLSDEAKVEIIKYFENEFERYLKDKDNLTSDELYNLELMADACKPFISGKIIAILKEILKLKFNSVRCYAIETLLLNNQQIDEAVIRELANDLIYADMIYFLLKNHSKECLFPKEFANAEYLAKSDLVHWLVYPTELGKEPDDIQLLGNVKIKKKTYYVFKYKSDSDNLSDELKNVWLIGWACAEGRTFSNFDELSKFEQENIEKTLKIIAKKLIR